MAVLVWAPSSSPCVESSPTQPGQEAIQAQSSTQDSGTNLSLFSDRQVSSMLEVASRIPLACGLQVSDPFTPCQGVLSPLPPLLPAAPQGRRRRRWLHGADQPPSIALPLSTNFAPSCSCLDIGACGWKADGLVAWLVVLLAVVHAGHHRQDEGLGDQQLHVHLWKKRVI